MTIPVLVEMCVLVLASALELKMSHDRASLPLAAVEPALASPARSPTPTAPQATSITASRPTTLIQKIPTSPLGSTQAIQKTFPPRTSWAQTTLASGPPLVLVFQLTLPMPPALTTALPLHQPCPLPFPTLALNLSLIPTTLVTTPLPLFTPVPPT